MNARNVITFLTLLFLPAVAFASGEASNVISQLITSYQKLILTFGFLVGLGLTVSGGYKLTLMNEQGQKNAKTVPLMSLLAGALMMNAMASLGLFSETYFSTSDLCFVVKDGVVNSSCMSDEMSGITGELKTRIEKLSSGSTAQVFLTNVSNIVGLFQIIGLIYFLIGVYGLTQVANGSAQNGYGKPVITMFASSLIVALPHTVQIMIDTLETVGFNF
ncbi:hypothetical protein ATI02_3344 [Pseudomonas baetica]|uniref:Type III secretion protein n=1 Tax=Pseudomonas baetica TaxID=674054 RepID=A0ABX4Q107_9PSED|nr:hypothetical protein [Pseudomonas baetica]PKA70439.1 hypothetical protein ATI02_3344 [Pseudomonas baetica]PTC16545.1 hypothetical protein C0J26_30115 [Pseudomonas baetica]